MVPRQGFRVGEGERVAVIEAAVPDHVATFCSNDMLLIHNKYSNSKNNRLCFRKEGLFHKMSNNGR